MPFIKLCSLSLVVCLLPGCEQPSPQQTGARIEMTGSLTDQAINEASGMQASFSYAGDFFVHNDDGGTVIYATDAKGRDLGSVRLVPARSLDWEDITSVPVGSGRWLVIGDIGDNLAKRPYITLYFAREPIPGKRDRYGGILALEHRVDLTYPDGPRDCESLAYDPVARQLLLVSKRDRPAHIYAVDIDAALERDQLDLAYLGNLWPLRPPAPADQARWGGRWDWISQPTGMDIRADGSEAVVLTYRSLYRFRRKPGETWLHALGQTPQEVVGPPGPQNEAVAYSRDGQRVFVTSENLPASIYRVSF